MKRESFVYYRDFYNVLKTMPEEDYRKVDEAVKLYAFDGIEPTDLNPMQMITFNYCKKFIDKNNRKYLSGLKGKEYGKLGGRPNSDGVSEITPKKPQNNPKITPNEGYIDENQKPLKNPKETPKKPQNDVTFEEEEFFDITQIDINDNINNNYIYNKNKEESGKKKEKGKEQILDLLEKRKQDFYNSLIPFVDKYGRELVGEFFDYWTEPNKSKTKMRFELERAWDTNRRLSKWANNQKTWSNNQKTNCYGTNRYERAKQAEQQLIEDVAISSIRKLEQERSGDGVPMLIDL